MSRLLHAASLVITDRRWAAPLSAMALGFGLFIGVAIGPGASGTLATGAPQVIEVPGFGGDSDGGEGEGGGAPAFAGPATGGGGGGGASALPSTAPSLPPYVEPVAAPPPVSETPASAPQPAPAGPPVEEEPDAQEMSGVVVGANPAAGSYALALDGGELVAVHAVKLPRPGVRLTVPIRRLANGTLAEAEKPQREGAATRATFNGTVTFVDAESVAPAYTVSRLGASILVRVPVDPAGVAPALPALGSSVIVDAAIEPRAPLRQLNVRVDDIPPSSYLELAGIHGGLDPASGHLLLSADGPRESGKDLALRVPPSIDLAGLRVGDSLLATATIEPDGSLALTGLAGDEGLRGADDAGSAQGDLRR